MTMQNRQLGSGFGIVDIKFLSKFPTELELENFGPNEYLLIKTEGKTKLIYIDNDNKREEILISKIEGLDNALSKFEEDNKIPVLDSIQKYHLKTHGGNEFLLFKDEKYQGLINYFPKEKISLVREWISSTHENKLDISSILDDQTLALIVPDILVDLDVTRLSKIIPNIIINLPDEIKESFSNRKLFEKLDRRFLNSIRKSVLDKMPNSLDNLAKIDPEVMAYLIPAILDLMDNEALRKASVAIAKQLAPKDFRAIADENYFQPHLDMLNDQVTLKNNKRTLSFFATNSTSMAEFRNRKWQFDHTHIHLEGNGEEREYKIYDSRKQLEDVKNGLIRDPNLDIVGEIHSVYKRTTKHGITKYMAVGFLLKIGEENTSFEKVLRQVEDLEQLTEDRKLDILINYQHMFMPTFQKAQKTNSILFHSWASLKSQTPGFKAGLRFNVIPDTIQVSQTQYNRFKQLFGNMAVLTEEKVLEPIDRKADHRQARVF